MHLYVCYGTFRIHDSHPCREAHQALTDAGYQPKVVRTGGCYGSDPLWPGRRKVKRLTGNYKVPTLRLDDGRIVDGSENIVAWAAENPMPQSASPIESAPRGA
jgi:hypothetical protein